MNLLDVTIIIVISSLLLIAAYKLFQDAKQTKAGLGCAGCRISDSCQKTQNLNRIKNSKNL